MLAVFHLILNAAMGLNHLYLYAEIVLKWKGRVERDSDCAEAISGRCKWGQWGHGDVPAWADWVRNTVGHVGSTHNLNSLTMPCATEYHDWHPCSSDMPLYLIKHQLYIRCPQLSGDRGELALLLVGKDGEMSDRLDSYRGKGESRRSALSVTTD